MTRVPKKGWAYAEAGEYYVWIWSREKKYSEKDDLIIGNVAPGDGQNKKWNLFISATMRTMSLLKVINILFDEKKKKKKRSKQKKKQRKEKKKGCTRDRNV